MVYTTSQLENRGIDAAAVVAGWQEHAINWKPKGESEAVVIPGWIYPLWEPDGQEFPGVKRWKSAAPDTKTPSGKGTPKCLWRPSKTARPDFYMLPGTLRSIEKNNGKIVIVGGEPDVLVAQMVGLPSICWFGENAIPDNLAMKLIALGVREATYYFDNDKTGMESARLVNEALQGTDIVYTPRQLRGEDKADFNTVWIQSEMERTAFFDLLRGCEVSKDAFEPSKKAIREAGRSTRETSYRGEKEHYTSWALDIERKAVASWGIAQAGGDEYSTDKIACPFHDDQTPSAQWNYRVHGLKCFGECGKTYNTKEVAARLGEPEYSAPKREKIQTPRQKQGQKNGQKQLQYVTSGTAIAELRKITNGETFTDLPPIPCPYAPLRKLGGLIGLWDRKKIISVLGGSGLGKTAFIMTITDMLRQKGYDVFVLGPEWTPVNYTMRAVARAGGPSYNDQRWSKVFYSMTESDRVKMDDPKIKPLTPGQKATVNQILDDMDTWPGYGYYLGKQTYTQTMRFLPDECERLRSEGRNPAVFILDYAQKLRVAGGSWASAVEDVAVLLSNAIQAANLAGVLVSQVSKSEARKIKENAGGTDSLAGMGLSDHLVQGVIVLRPHFENRKDPETDIVTKVRVERADIFALKDNAGPVPRQITVKTKLYAHQYTEQIVKSQKKDG
jgi:hypothetical protein